MRHLIGLLIGVGGIMVLVWPEIRLGESPGFFGGVVATQLGCAGWAVGSAAAALYLLLLGSIVGFTAYAYALIHLPITTVSLCAYITR